MDICSSEMVLKEAEMSDLHELFLWVLLLPFTVRRLTCRPSCEYCTTFIHSKNSGRLQQRDDPAGALCNFGEELAEHFQRCVPLCPLKLTVIVCDQSKVTA